MHLLMNVISVFASVRVSKLLFVCLTILFIIMNINVENLISLVDTNDAYTAF